MLFYFYFIIIVGWCGVCVVGVMGNGPWFFMNQEYAQNRQQQQQQQQVLPRQMQAWETVKRHCHEFGVAGRENSRGEHWHGWHGREGKAWEVSASHTIIIIHTDTEEALAGRCLRCPSPSVVSQTQSNCRQADSAHSTAQIPSLILPAHLQKVHVSC